MRWMVIYEYEVPGKFYYTTQTMITMGNLPLQEKIPMVEPGIEPGIS
jgi:hypothetical protein